MRDDPELKALDADFVAKYKIFRRSTVRIFAVAFLVAVVVCAVGIGASFYGQFNSERHSDELSHELTDSRGEISTLRAELARNNEVAACRAAFTTLQGQRTAEWQSAVGAFYLDGRKPAPAGLLQEFAAATRRSLDLARQRAAWEVTQVLPCPVGG